MIEQLQRIRMAELERQLAESEAARRRRALGRRRAAGTTYTEDGR